jgi:predicted transcriptional regulator of viral defense system
MSTTQTARILDLAREQQLLSAADLRARGWSPQLLLKLHQAGRLHRVGRGLYRLPDDEITTGGITAHHALAEVCRRVPKGVVCLVSALQFHEVGTQLPGEIWIALPEATHAPAFDYPPLRIVRLRGLAHSAGIESVAEHGSIIRVYSVAKTVADCFKFRHKIGLDVALEALKDGWRQRKLSIDELTHFARINRVERVMQPYLETVVA